MANQYKNSNVNVRKLENDYVRSTDSYIKNAKKRRIALRKRLLVFSIFALAVMISLISMIFSQNSRLAEKEAEKKELLAELENVKKHQKELKLQIKKLEDDEYIAKIARKEYFLSEDGEIIFTIPNEDKKQEKISE